MVLIMAGTIWLNLARKYRPKTFNEIVGQTLTVSLLKNSLHLARFFPVYLLSGLRGSGKTSIGRIFAAAVNCNELIKFQENKEIQKFPCLECQSCKAMLEGNHPDFIEIDAASHTGVDNVRSIIEAASFLPIMGQKKIYLIDEAHMLSKAAFNAFLKILEEPPPRAVFMLATTDIEKILPTVKSRSFQLFFDPIGVNEITNSLQEICVKENIPFEEQALKIIAQESQGSLRDGTNIVERIRLSSSSITLSAVNDNLGIIPDTELIDIFAIALSGSKKGLLEKLNSVEIINYCAIMLFKRFLELIRTLIRVRYQIAYPQFLTYQKELTQILKHCSIEDLILFLDIFYRLEPQFVRSPLKHLILETMLLKIASSRSSKSRSASHKATQNKLNPEEQTSASFAPSAKLTQKTEEIKPDEVKPKEVRVEPENKEHDKWDAFLAEIQKIGNPFVASVFKQGKMLKDATEKELEILFPKKFEFYKDWLFDNKQFWQPAVENIFGANIDIVPKFLESDKKVLEPLKQRDHPIKKVEPEQKKKFNMKSRPVLRSLGEVGKKHVELDVSDAGKWKKAHKFLKIFPGKITIIEEAQDG